MSDPISVPSEVYDDDGRPLVWCLSRPDENANRMTRGHDSGEGTIRVVPEVAFAKAESEKLRAERERDEARAEVNRAKGYPASLRERAERAEAALQEALDLIDRLAMNITKNGNLRRCASAFVRARRKPDG